VINVNYTIQRFLADTMFTEIMTYITISAAYLTIQHFSKLLRKFRQTYIT